MISFRWMFLFLHWNNLRLRQSMVIIIAQHSASDCFSLKETCNETPHGNFENLWKNDGIIE